MFTFFTESMVWNFYDRNRSMILFDISARFAGNFRLLRAGRHRLQRIAPIAHPTGDSTLHGFPTVHARLPRMAMVQCQWRKSASKGCIEAEHGKAARSHMGREQEIAAEMRARATHVTRGSMRQSDQRLSRCGGSSSHYRCLARTCEEMPKQTNFFI